MQGCILYFILFINLKIVLSQYFYEKWQNYYSLIFQKGNIPIYYSETSGLKLATNLYSPHAFLTPTHDPW